MVGKHMKQKVRSASSVKLETYIVTPITSFDTESLNKKITPTLKQNRLERLAGVKLYRTGRYKWMKQHQQVVVSSNRQIMSI